MTHMYRQMMGWTFCITLSLMNAAAQTNTFPATGNVGIGTTSPGANLQVIGATSLQGTTYIGQNTNGTAVIDAYNGNAYFGDNSASNGIAVTSSGNVGIGTTSPGLPLQVNGTIAAVSGLGAYLIPNPGFSDGFYQGLGVNGYFNGTNWIFPTDGANSAGSLILTNEGAGALNFYTIPSAGSTAQSISSASLGNYQRMTITNAGSVGIGTANPGAALEVNGNIKLTAGSGTSITFPDGSVQSVAYTGVTCGGDYAESVDVTGDRMSYEPGDVIVINPNAPGKFLKANQPYSTLVAGIYSTRPGTVGRRQLTPKSSDEVPMAMMGIVPTKVTAENGPIKTGDLLVASSTMGRAMKGTDRNLLTGAVIGKALGSLASGAGMIEVLVTLQ